MKILTRMISLRLTEEEYTHLDACRGQIPRSRFLRDLIMAASDRPPAPPIPTSLSTDRQPKEPRERIRTHRHTRDTLIRTEWDRGSEVQIYRCACGEEIRR